MLRSQSRVLALALGLVAVAAAGGSQPIAFGPPLHLPTSQPSSLAAADFNGDLLLDIVATNAAAFGVSTVTVFLNTGARSFGPGTSFPAGQNPRTVNVADFNRDGRLDVAVANNGDGTVAVLLGDGAGGFGAPIATSAALGNLACITTGTFDGDSNPDAIAGGFTPPQLSVLIGDGSGGLSAPTLIPSVGLSPIDMISGHFDGDGNLDFAAANFNGTNTPGGDVVSVHLGNGSGGFPPFASYPVPTHAEGIAAGDVDDNGSLDLVVASIGPPAGSMSTLLNTGAGTFGPAITLPLVPGQPSCVALADFNLDGALDAIVGRAGFDVVVLAGANTGAFVPVLNLVASGAQDTITADFDGDGRPDAAVANFPDEVLVFFNDTRALPVVPAVPAAGAPALLLLAALLAALGVARLVKLRAGAA